MLESIVMKTEILNQIVHGVKLNPIFNIVFSPFLVKNKKNTYKLKDKLAIVHLFSAFF